MNRYTRRAILLGSAGTVLTGCARSRGSSSAPLVTRSASRGVPTVSAGTGAPVLLAYFSRAGENYFNGGRRRLTVGYTEVVAKTIRRLIGCDTHRIEAADPYSDDYAPTVRRNVEEQRADARPGIVNPLTSVARYGTVLLGSPIWNVRAPMIMTTFVEGLDLDGKTIHPFTTHAMSGLGSTERDYAASCPGAKLGEGLAIRGEQADQAEPAIDAWLRRIGLLTS